MDDVTGRSGVTEAAPPLGGGVRKGVGVRFPPPALEPRLASKVRVASSGCWEWIAGLFSTGYAQAWDPVLQRPRAAHRMVYEALVGPIPDGLHLDHLCRNIICVSPDHLEPVTNEENVRRGAMAVPTCKAGLHPKTALGRCRPCFNDYMKAWKRSKRRSEGRREYRGRAA